MRLRCYCGSSLSLVDVSDERLFSAFLKSRASLCSIFLSMIFSTVLTFSFLSSLSSLDPISLGSLVFSPRILGSLSSRICRMRVSLERPPILSDDFFTSLLSSRIFCRSPAMFLPSPPGPSLSLALCSTCAVFSILAALSRTESLHLSHLSTSWAAILSRREGLSNLRSEEHTSELQSQFH